MFSINREGAFSRTVAHLLMVILLTLFLTLALRWALDHTLELGLDQRFWHRDFAGNLVVSLVCLALTRSWGRAMVLAGILVIGFQACNAGKLVVLGTPISPDDFVHVKNLFLLWEGWMLWGTIAAVVLPLIAFALLVSWRTLATWATLGAMGAAMSLTVLYSSDLRAALDRNFGNSVWNQPENFKRRGLGLHILQESVRAIAKVGQLPSEPDVRAALDTRSGAQTRLEGIDKRNVHMIVLESFFDPNKLGPEWVPEDPLPEAFHALWDDTGRSTVLAPVFGGYTANAEFEALCGFPVTENAVFFEGWLRRSAPCLPAMLRDAGFSTVASHPNVAGFWNRTHAYRLVGFETYWSKSRFDTADSVGNFLLDHSYYQQVFDQLQAIERRPLFNYMLTIHGHLPYPTNERYSDRVAVGGDSALLKQYINHMYYKSRDLMAMLEQLRKDDPEALIVVFGDHLPFLGPNYELYTDVGKLMPDREDFTGDMFEFLVSTPLIVIDGKRGPLRLGQLPMYRLPALIMSLLGATDSGIADWSNNPSGKIIRPIYGMHFYLQDGNAVVCRSDDAVSEACDQSERWMQRIKTLSADVFTGKQFSLRSQTP